MTPLAAIACGYHDNVSMSRGLLNWLYPDALHVVGAISAAVAERRLPGPSSDTAAPDLFGSRYRHTASALEAFGNALSAASGNAPPLSFSVVLVEPVLWTRFAATQSERQPRLHVTGPQPRDLVLVTGETVIGEVAGGRLAIVEAYRLGLVRLYGSNNQKARFIATYRMVGGQPVAPATQ